LTTILSVPDAEREPDVVQPYIPEPCGDFSREQDVLKALGISGEWIWGNDLETIVFAQAFGHQKTLIF
jgi:hypothetical protein